MLSAYCFHAYYRVFPIIRARIWESSLSPIRVHHPKLKFRNASNRLDKDFCAGVEVLPKLLSENCFLQPDGAVLAWNCRAKPPPSLDQFCSHDGDRALLPRLPTANKQASGDNHVHTMDESLRLPGRGHLAGSWSNRFARNDAD